MTPIKTIEINNVSKEFLNVKALDGLEIKINEGEIYALLGHNGAGKTTTLRLILGLLKPDNGQISVFGLDPSTQGIEIRKMCGVLSEHVGLYEPLTVYENLRYYAEIYGLSKDDYEKRIDELLLQFEILNKKNSPVKGFSTGMKKKVAIIRAILHKPKIILLDEPTNGLDPVSRINLKNMILELSKNYQTTFILTTHNLDEVAKICDKISILKNGKNTVTKTLSELAVGSEISLMIKCKQNLSLYTKTINKIMDETKAINSYKVLTKELYVEMNENVLSDIIKKLTLANIDIDEVDKHSFSLQDLYMEVEMRSVD